MSVSTDEFYKDLLIYVDRELESTGDDGNNCENIFTEKIISDLSSGETPVVRGFDDTTFRYESIESNSKINAFHLDEESERSITVYTTRFFHTPSISRLTAMEVDNTLKRLSNFMHLIEKTPETLLSTIEEEHPLYSLVFELASHYDEYDSINYILLTNGLVGEIKVPSFSIFGKPVDVCVYDIERYKRFLDNQKIESIVADISVLKHPLKCSHLSTSDGTYDVYSCILSGNVIYRLFDKFHFRLLNSNVRTYLQLRGSVNKGIMDTLKTTPAKFLAYNNGISATASKVELDDNGDIIGIHDFQIVNGGQTSASIYKAKANFDVDLDDVYVLVKITVVNNPDMYNMMVKNISRYANTQNKIKVSDLSSNDSYNVELAKLSRSIYAPAMGSKLPTKWYYENVEGSYNIECSQNGRAFEKEYPKTQKFSKTDLAVIELAYQGFPEQACKGAQDAYKAFTQNIQDFDTPVDKDFKNIVAKKILYDTILGIITDEGIKQGKKSMAAYVLAYLAEIVCKRKLNLKTIWEEQTVSEELKSDIRKLSRKIWSVLWDGAVALQKSVEMYCKRLTTWNEIKEETYPSPNVSFYIGEEELKPILTNVKVKASLSKIVQQLTSEDWVKMSQNISLAQTSKEGIDSDRKMCISMATTKLENLSEKQVGYALKIIFRMYNAGYQFNDTISTLIDAKRNDLDTFMRVRISSLSTESYFSKQKRQ